MAGLALPQGLKVSASGGQEGKLPVEKAHRLLSHSSLGVTCVPPLAFCWWNSHVATAGLAGERGPRLGATAVVSPRGSVVGDGGKGGAGEMLRRWSQCGE